MLATSRFRTALAAAGLIFAATSVAQPTPGSIQLTTITNSLSGPVGVFSANDGSNRLFPIQQGGQVRVVRDGVLNPANFLTLSNANTQCRETPASALVNTGFVVGSETGLLGLAFHPSFESNGLVFVSFSGAQGDTILTRYTMADPSVDAMTAADQQTCVVVLRVDQDFSNHNGGNIVFGPDGFLYFGLGDGGSGNDPCNRAQTLDPAALVNTGGSCPSDTTFTDPDNNGTPDRTTFTRALLGKMLRIDVNGTTPAGANGLCGDEIDGSADYAVPPTNPFAGADPESGCDEVWMYGLRNPWRWSFDRSTGDFIIGDVGQDHWEEVSLFAAPGRGAGANMDWRVCEARHVSGQGAVNCTTLCGGDTTEVIIEYNNTGGCASPTPVTGISVTGGYRYRGPDALLTGVYFYGDAGSSNLYYSVNVSGNTWTQPGTPNSVVSGAAGGVVVGFGEDEFGALYVVGGSRLTRIGAAAPAGFIFANGFE